MNTPQKICDYRTFEGYLYEMNDLEINLKIECDEDER